MQRHNDVALSRFKGLFHYSTLSVKNVEGFTSKVSLPTEVNHSDTFNPLIHFYRRKFPSRLFSELIFTFMPKSNQNNHNKTSPDKIDRLQMFHISIENCSSLSVDNSTMKPSIPTQLLRHSIFYFSISELLSIALPPLRVFDTKLNLCFLHGMFLP